MAKRSLAHTKRALQARSGGGWDRWGRPRYGNAGDVERDLVWWLNEVIGAHPDIKADLATVRAFLAEPRPEADQQRAKTGAMLWMIRRYPHLARYPGTFSDQAVHNVLAGLVAGTDRKQVRRDFLLQAGYQARYLTAPVHVEVWLASQPAPPDDDAAFTGLDATTLRFEQRLYPPSEEVAGQGATTPLVEASMPRPVWLAWANPGFSTVDLVKAVTHSATAFARTYEGYEATGRGGNVPRWRHWPALYRHWRSYPEAERCEPDTGWWMDFADTFLASDACPDHWRPDPHSFQDGAARQEQPTHWKTVRDATDEAIAWLRPAIGGPPTPALA